MEAVSAAKLHQLLNDNSTSKFYILFKFKDAVFAYFNHMAHGIISLARLGVSEQNIIRFIDHYKNELEPSERYKSEEQLPSIATKDIESLLGKHKCFYQLLEHYETLLKSTYSEDIHKLVLGEFDKLSKGIICGALHGLIHLGYGLSVGNARVVCEGLAYLHHSYLPIVVEGKSVADKPLGRGTREIADALLALRNDVEFHRRIQEDLREKKVEQWWNLDITRKINKMGLTSSRADDLLRYVDDIKIPQNLLRGETIEDHSELIKCIMDSAILVYIISEPRNNFFLLHGVTAAWSLLQIVSILEDLRSEQVLRYAKLFLFCLLAVYVTQGCPTLNPGLLEAELASAKDRSWDDIIAEAMVDPNTDEHVLKLIHVCRERDFDRDGMTAGLKTDFYIAAALTAMKHPFDNGRNVRIY